MKKSVQINLFIKLACLSGGLVILTIMTTQLYFVRHERTMLEMGLREKVNFITNWYALGVVEALQHNDDIMLQQIMTGLEQDREVLSTMVVDSGSQVRYDTDPEKVATTVEDPLIKGCLTTGEGVATQGTNSGGKSLLLIAPLKLKGKRLPIGVLRLEITYKHLNDLVRQGQASFEMTAMGSLFMCIGGMLWGFRRWVTGPLSRMKNLVTTINPTLLDTQFPEPDDEFGEMGGALNNLMVKLRTEWAAQSEKMTIQAGDERVLIEQILRGLLPTTRILLSDKQNRLICDTGADSTAHDGPTPHLLDVVDNVEFAALIELAFRKEGEAVRAKITFQSNPYIASVLKIPDGQSKLVRVVLVLATDAPAPTATGNA